MNFTALLENYDGLSALLALLGVIALIKVGKFLAFKVPALARMKKINREEDKKKLAQAKYRPMIKSSRNVGLACNLTFFIVVLPFCITMASTPAWKILLDVVIILMFYDFFYYCAHRFWFHGNGPMRKIHAVHHQARSPTFVDALYVHPFETFIGLALYIVSIALLAALMGPFHV
ncbi:MAG: sterol desaturase family protein, partial [Proteobacteria bacterium]|nr:sterol desaturase family protein [Pseudomonadota bacterium]